MATSISSEKESYLLGAHDCLVRNPRLEEHQVDGHYDWYLVGYSEMQDQKLQIHEFCSRIAQGVHNA